MLSDVPDQAQKVNHCPGSAGASRFWGARAASPQLPAACRQHFATVHLESSCDSPGLGNLPRPTGWQPVLPGNRGRVIAPAVLLPPAEDGVPIPRRNSGRLHSFVSHSSHRKCIRSCKYKLRRSSSAPSHTFHTLFSFRVPSLSSYSRIVRTLYSKFPSNRNAQSEFNHYACAEDAGLRHGGKLGALAENFAALSLHPLSRTRPQSEHRRHGSDAFRNSHLLDLGTNYRS